MAEYAVFPERQYHWHFIQHTKSTAPEGIQVMEIEVRQDHNIRKLFVFLSEGSSLGRLHVWEALVLFEDEGCPFERLLKIASFWTELSSIARVLFRVSNPIMLFAESLQT